jgi:predicted PurR-regulated permease PerM
VAGALLQALVAGISTWAVLTILGVDYALPLAVIVFLLDLIPLVGATLGAIIVGIVTAFSDFPLDTIIWTIYAIVYQQVENNVIQPRIQARAVQLEPLVVLISVLFGSALFGVLGALLAIPIAAAIQITIREYVTLRRLSLVPGATQGAPATPGPEPRSADP